jgi:hypothetical protein
VTALVLFVSIALGAACLGWGYWQVGLSQFARWIAIFGVVWLIAAWRRSRWFSYVGVGFSFLVAALGLWFLSFPPGWMFAGAICALVAWDLTYFRYRLRFAADDEEKRLIELRHLTVIAGLALLGFLLASMAMTFTLRFNLEWAVLLVLVSALSLMQIIRWFRRRGS